jgi:curli production assembly/transport component CsgG
MRSTYLGENGINPHALPPLLFAGVILEGGVISYDSNTKTGGLGARFLGIGGNTSYREDTVTVYLRAVSTKTGEVLLSINSRKSIASVGLTTNTFRYVGFQDLLEIDGGITSNEPSQLALQQAIGKAVYGLVMEGAEQRLWCFSDTPAATSDLLRHHIADRDHIKFEDAKLPVDTAGHDVTGACGNGTSTAALIDRPGVHLDDLAAAAPAAPRAALPSVAPIARVATASPPARAPQMAMATLAAPASAVVKKPIVPSAN